MSDNTCFSPDEQAIASSLLKLQKLEQSSPTKGSFILFGFLEEQQQDSKGAKKQVPKTLVIQHESSDSDVIYETSLKHVQETTLNYFIYRATQETGAPKYMCVSWIGNRVKPLVKAKATSHKDFLVQFCEKTLGVKFSDELNVNQENHKDLNDEYLIGRLFPKNNDALPKQSASSSIASRISSSPSASSSSARKPQASRNSNNIASQLRLVLSIDESGLTPLLKEINLTSSNSTSWAVFAYDDNGVLRVTNHGDEQHTVDQIRPHLADDDINYALVKWNMGTELGYGKDTEKALLVVWVGSKINSIRRGKVNQHKAKVYQFINSVVLLAGEYEVTSGEEFTSDIVKNRMLGNKSTVSTSVETTPQQEAKSTASKPTHGRTGSLWNLAKVVPKTQYLLRKEAAKAASNSGKKALSTAANTIKIFASEECAEELEKFVGNDSLAIWALFGYHEGTNNCLHLIESGSQEASKLLSDNQTLQQHLTEEKLSFIIVKLYCRVTKGRSRAIVPKFVLVTFKGKKLKPYFKVISANHAGKLKNTVAPIVPIEDAFATITDITELNNLQALLPREEVVGGPDDIADIIKSPRSARGAPSSVVVLEGLTFEDEKAVQDALKDLQSDETDSNWVMVGYTGRKKLKLTGSGSKGIEEFTAKINEKEVQYIFYKLFIEELGGSAKIVLIAYCGKEVKMALKAASTPDRIALFKWAGNLCGVSSEYQANEKDDLTLSAITGKVTGSKGKAGETTRTKSTQSSAAKRYGGKNQELKVANEEQVAVDLKDLKDDSTTTNWLLFEYDKSGANLELVKKGSDGLEGLRPSMDRSKVQYALLKLIVEETGYGGSPKVTLITWVGEDVTGIAKAKSSTHRILLKDFCVKTLAIAAEFPANSEQELNEVAIRGKLTGAKGLVEENGSMVATVGTQKTFSHKKFGGTNVNMKFADEKAVIDAVEAMRDNKSNVKWLMFGYPDPEDYYTTAVVQKGSGGVAGYKQYLRNDTVNYILMRMTFMEYYEVCKVVLVTFVGEEAPSFLKSVSAGHRVNLMEFARKYVSIGGEYQPHDLEEFSDQTLLGKITGAKGGENVDLSKGADGDSEDTATARWTPQRDIRPTIKVEEMNKFSGEYKALDFEGKEEIKKALKDLAERSDVVYQDEASRLDFIKLKIQGKNMRQVVVEEVGKGSLTDEWREKHLDVNKINVFIFAVSSSEGGTGMITKFVFVQWNGGSTKFLDRAAASELRQTLYDYCSSIVFMGAEIQGCTQPEHVTKKLVLEKLTGSNVRGKEMSVQKKQEKFMKLGKEKSKLSYESEKDIYDALEKLVPLEDNEIDWLLVTYVENKIDVLKLAHTGKGDCEAFKQYLTPTNMCFVVIRVMHAFGYQKDFADTLSKPYYGLVHWKGAEVSVLEKAMSSHHWNNFAKMIGRKLTAMQLAVQGSQYHAEYLEEVTMERISKAMRLFD